MLVLGLDTSSPAIGVALVELEQGLDGDARWGRQADWQVVDARAHGELLATGVRAVLQELGARPRDVGAVAVGLGPGPYTGLRVGVMTAGAFADAASVPVYGSCSLDAVGGGDRVGAADARRKEVYWARYAGGARVEGPAVERPADLAARLQGTGARLVGAGAVLHPELFDGPVDERAVHPSGPSLVRLAADRVLAGAPSEALTPLYLRRPDAVEPGATKRVTA